MRDIVLLRNFLLLSSSVIIEHYKVIPICLTLAIPNYINSFGTLTSKITYCKLYKDHSLTDQHKKIPLHKKIP